MMCDSITSSTATAQGTKRTHSGSHRRPSVSNSSTMITMGASENPLSSLTRQSPVTPEIRNHIDALKHLDDWLIFELLQSARHYASGSSGSGSALKSRSHSQSRMSDSRYSTASSSTLISQSSQTSYTTQLGALAEACGPSKESLPTSTKTGSSSTSNLRSPNSTVLPTQKPLPPDPPTKTADTITKHYVCTFCEETFDSKAYWRTHEEELHEQPRRWTCPDCYRTFHAEKKYRRHHAESHDCASCTLSKYDELMQNPKSRSCVERRLLRVHNKQAYGCGFCAHLLGSWEERCDHIAGHYERGAVKRDWEFSNVVRGLLIQPKLAEAWMALLRAQHGDEREAWPRFAWDKKVARDLHRALEQNGAVRDRVAALAQIAYDLGKPMNDAAPVAESRLDNTLRAFQSSRKSGKAKTDFRAPSTAIQPVQPRAPETTVVPVSSQPPSEPHTGTPAPQAQHAMTVMDFLHNALNEQLTSGPFIAPDLDFHPDWSLVQNESDILTFDYPGAYTEFETRRL